MYGWNEYEYLEDYEFVFGNKMTSPNREWTQDVPGSCPSYCAKRNETQGITNIDGIYWILSKNKWIDVFEVDDSSFSISDKIFTIDNGYNYTFNPDPKNGDIDYEKGEFFVPSGANLVVYGWNGSELIEKNVYEMSSFGVAVHPINGHVFGQADDDGYIYGYKLNKNSSTKICKNTIALYDISGQRINHEEITNNHWTQGLDFSPNGRYLFYVHDDEFDVNSLYTGIYVYYFDDENFNKLSTSNCFAKSDPIKAILVGFKNIPYDPDVNGVSTARLDELEGIDIGKIGEYEIHQLMLHNTAGDNDEKYSVYHYKSPDYDYDTINDIYDNCPFVANSEQYDLDGDSIGDACDSDVDGDGKLNEEDNCPILYDESNRKIFFCEDVDGDEVCDSSVRKLCKTVYENGGINSDAQQSIYNQRWERRPVVFLNGIRNMLIYEEDVRKNFVDNCPGINNPFSYEEGEIMFGIDPADDITVTGVGALKNTRINTYSSGYYYYWQPDHNLDGNGDACDYGNINNPNDVGTRYSKVTNTDSYTKKGTDPLIRNEYLTIDMKMFGQNENVDDTREQSLRYCNLPLSQEEDWGKDGFCTNTKNSETYKEISHKVRDYSFSHGSDPKPFDERGDTWRELNWTSNPACLSISNSQSSNFYVMNEAVPGAIDLSKICDNRTSPLAGTKKSSTIYWNWRNNFYLDWGLDFFDELYPEEIDIPIPQGRGISHFRFTLSVGVKGQDNNYLSSGLINANHFYNTERYARSARFYDTGIGYYKWEPIDLVEPERMIYFDDWLREIFLREGLFFPEKGWNKFIKWTGSWKDTIKSVPVYIDNFYGAVAEKDGFIFAVDEDQELGTITFKYNHIENSAGWIDAATFSNIPSHLEPAGLSVSDEKMFVLMRNDDTEEYSLFSAGSETLEEIDGLPVMDNITFIEYDGAVYIAGNTGGYMEMYELYQTESGGYALSYVESTQKPSARALFNIHSDETGIYLAGGGNTDWQTIEVKRDVWKFDAENGWQVLNSDTGKDLFKLFMRKEGDNLLMVFQTGLNGNIAKYITFNTSDGTVIEEGFVPVEGAAEVEENSICRTADTSFFWAGFESAGICNKFSAPDYSYFNAGTKIYAVEGFGKYLFAAHGNGIRVYDISNPVSPVLKNNISLYGPVRDLEIEGERVFAATGNGIDILKFNGSSLVIEKHIATYGDSAVMKRYGNYLIIGDGQGLKKLDISTQNIVQQVNTSGDVTTLVIKDGIIHLYDWAGLKRYNAETFVRITTSSSYKSSPELALTIDDRIFVTYSAKVYELTYNGNTPVYTQKTGDALDVRDGYSFDGYGYFAKGNGIRISTMAEIMEAVCGNGVIEPGEVCDGNSVACTTVNSDYDSGTAYCNSTCNGYNESSCETDDGW